MLNLILKHEARNVGTRVAETLCTDKGTEKTDHQAFVAQSVSSLFQVLLSGRPSGGGGVAWSKDEEFVLRRGDVI